MLPPNGMNPPDRKLRATLVRVSAILLIFLFGSLAVSRFLANPRVVLLLPEHGAEWIRLNEPLSLQVHASENVVTSFRTQFSIETVPTQAVLTLRALKLAAVFIDGKPALAPELNPQIWKRLRRVDVGPGLSAGSHSLQITVLNRTGPASMLAYCEPLNLFSSSDWEASRDEQTWTAASRVDDVRPAELSRQFPRSDRALVATLPVLAPTFLFVFCCSLARLASRNPAPWLRLITPSASGIRWMLLVAWAILGVNNFSKIPARVGFDIGGHMDYVRYVAERGRVPLASEGWQMFQSPLYYLIAAPIHSLLSTFLPVTAAWRLLRFLSLASGAIQIELCHRAMKYVCPKRQDLQSLGTVLGGLLPMNIYLSQVIGNEAMAGTFSAITLVLGLRLISSPAAVRSKRTLWLLGLFLGLAILTKATAILLVPPLLVLIPCALSRTVRPLRQIAGGMGKVFGTAIAVAGWYYIRNWVKLGSPFVGGWNQSRGIVWWQDPGYRTMSHFVRFGESLTYPVYSGVCGFWDAMYSSFWLDGWLSSVCEYELRPPWNYDFLISGAWLALLPAAGMLLGIPLAVGSACYEIRRGLRFAIGCVVVYFSAVFYLYVSLPIFSTAKASYTAGLIPCYAVLGATGLSLLMRGPISRAVVYAGIACWATAAYLAYFVM